jgi:hypothetical protein
MLVDAIINAKEVDVGVTTTFGAEIVPPRVGDIIVYNDKKWVVTKSEQHIRYGRTHVFYVTMEHKEDTACLFK